jgi:hypothetical protein
LIAFAIGDKEFADGVERPAERPEEENDIRIVDIIGLQAPAIHGGAAKVLKGSGMVGLPLFVCLF